MAELSEGSKVSATGGRPLLWRPSSLRSQEDAALGRSAARRRARRRCRQACENALRKLAEAEARPGSWQDRERAARPALVLAASGRRVPGARRRRRNAALHAARIPAVGFAAASEADLAWAAAGPRLGEMHTHEVHAEVLDGQLLNVAVPGTDALGFQPPCAFPIDEGVEDECSGWPAPGIWQPLSPDAETRIFADGLEAGWRLAEQYLEHRGPSEKLRTQGASLVSSGGVVEEVYEESHRGAPCRFAPGSFRQGARDLDGEDRSAGSCGYRDRRGVTGSSRKRAVHRRSPATSDPGPTAPPSADASGIGPPQQADCQQQ
ncbi:unnamed protein product [Prorocentrum cordatum]|uniref:Uncharacterized protein n=1 Tax=Prorocentrum cordatum TaxID=2364126 RepID=A0ABN9WIR2_9DINO|nr:unnamed protein product [Polarella glacialis]